MQASTASQQRPSASLAEGERPQTRPTARGVCFWYEGVHVANALASRRYRIGNFIELVRGASAVIGRRPPTHPTSTLCCLRPLVDSALARTLATMRQAGTRLVADYDDLIFAGEVDGLPASVGGPFGDRGKTARLRAYGAALDTFQAVTVSTRALARHAQNLAPRMPVTVVPNALSESWVRHGHALYRTFQPGDPLVIRYLCGSPSHDADFASIRRPLVQFLRDHRNVQLEVVGPVRFDASDIPPAQLRQLPSVPYEELPQLLATSWLNLAPLVSTAFNECKSAIKFLEAGAFGCPLLASPNDDMLRHRELGAPLALCVSERDWYEQLASFLDLEQRMSHGHAAAAHVARHGMAGNNLNTWLSSLLDRNP